MYMYIVYSLEHFSTNFHHKARIVAKAPEKYKKRKSS